MVAHLWIDRISYYIFHLRLCNFSAHLNESQNKAVRLTLKIFRRVWKTRNRNCMESDQKVSKVSTENLNRQPGNQSEK